MSYNATVYRYYADSGEHASTFVAEATPAGVMLRSNAVQFTGLEGTEQYDAYFRGQNAGRYVFRVVLDGTQGYRDFLRGFALEQGAVDRHPKAFFERLANRLHRLVEYPRAADRSVGAIR